MTTPAQTRFEMIATAFPLHCQRIAECVVTDGGGAQCLEWMREDSSAHNAASALGGAFGWCITTEGHEYWKALAEGAAK